MPDEWCPRGHVWVTYTNATVSVCQNCDASRPVEPLPYNDPLMVAEREKQKRKP